MVPIATAMSTARAKLAEPVWFFVGEGENVGQEVKPPTVRLRDISRGYGEALSHFFLSPEILN